tara:strand:- start:138223 stop:139617 length:1395 start_codon:yes stop_codon:yes gene_type:complete
MKYFKIIIFCAIISISNYTFSQASKSLVELQQDFIDLRFGMFIHYNIPTYMEEDWADPDAKPEIFNPKKVNSEQWAIAAKNANMTYGALTTKHHSGFCIWDTKTTDYSVMSSPYKKDVVKEFADAFRKKGLKVMLYYSILDTHHKIRPGMITQEKVQMIKDQITELLTNYGEIDALIIDGWDAPWSRISYDDVPFEELYNLIKSIQPNCLVMDLNAAKYPSEALFYTDIKSYEQNAGQHIEKNENVLPALSCYPLQQNWFWKPWFPDQKVKDATKLVNENLIPLNDAHCNFILNVAPNRNGDIDPNAMDALEAMGKIWKNNGPMSKLSGNYDKPIISSNIAKNKPSNSSWSNDMNIMDFANDDDFGTAWSSNKEIAKPWWEVEFDNEEGFNMISIVEDKPNISSYKVEYFLNNKWHNLLDGDQESRVKIHRFSRKFAEKVRISFLKSKTPPNVMEIGIYNERTN